MPPGFLAGLMYEPVLTVTVKSEKIVTALKALEEVNSEFTISPTLDIIQSVQNHESGYSNPLLTDALTRAQQELFDKYDNQSNLVRVLRLPTSTAKDDALSDIVGVCDNIVRFHRNPECTHPMNCCCCGKETELDLSTGFRVLKSTRKVHYVCECLVPCIQQLERSTEHMSFPTFRKLLLRLHHTLN